MKDVLVDALLGHLDEAIKQSQALGRPGAFAFDADGTLWSGDAGEDFLFALLERKLVLTEAMEALEREARSCGIDSTGLSATELARKLFDAYTAGAYPEEHICRVTAWACAGYTEASARNMAHGFLVDAKLPARILPETAEIMRFAAARGVSVYVVSASPEHVVAAGIRLAGLPCTRVFAATPQYALGRMIPRTNEPIPYGPGKRTILQAELAQTGGGELLAAFGDNVFDLPMLEVARFGVAVRPKKRLLDALSPGQDAALWHLLPSEA